MMTLELNDESRLLSHPIIWVGLSGGVDSIVLLHLLAQKEQFREKLKVIHVNHGLSPNALKWQQFCEDICRDWHIPFYSESLNLNIQSNIEETARHQRYAVFKQYIKKDAALVLAHHLDDQVETFLMNAIRGSGLKGLSSMPFYHQKKGFHLYRPLLDYPREVILEYAQSHQLKWMNDESNESVKFSRNYLRHVVIPTIESKWPSYRHSILKTIKNCQQTGEYLHIDLKNYLDVNDNLIVSKLKELDEPLLFEVFRAYFQFKSLAPPNQNVFKQIHKQLIYPQRLDSEACIHFSNWKLYEYDGCLFLEQYRENIKPCIWEDFPNDLYLDGLGIIKVTGESKFDVHHTFEIRFRVGGEKILYHGSHHSLKKLFQDWRIPPFQRASIPLLFVDNQLKAVVGYIESDDVTFKLMLHLI